jgi:hypothetical protein
MLPVVFLGSLLFMSGFFAGITLLVALILPHGMPVAPCNTCGGG